jgi:hypothetical protein
MPMFFVTIFRKRLTIRSWETGITPKQPGSRRAVDTTAYLSALPVARAPTGGGRSTGGDAELDP